MKILGTTRCLGLAMFLATAGLSSASIVGHLSEANCSGGGVTVTATTITWLPAADPGFGCISTGITTDLTWSGGGSLGPGVNGEIKNLVFAPNVNVDDFMVFPAPPIAASSLDFVLTSLPGATGSDGVCTTSGTGVTNVGDSCTLIAGYTPFLLTYNGIVGGVANTTITALAGGTVADPNDHSMSTWGGNFHTSLTMTPAQIEEAFLTTGHVSSTQAGDFDVSAASVPEPGSLLLMGAGAGLIGLAKLLRKRK